MADFRDGAGPSTSMPYRDPGGCRPSFAWLGVSIYLVVPGTALAALDEPWLATLASTGGYRSAAHDA
jgi:hypothetical protein